MHLLTTLALISSATASYPMLGWDAYSRFDMFTLRPGEITKQFSSYDRTNGNNDGYYGTYSCLYNSTDGRCVIADAKGPGEIASIWFTYENDSVVPIGDIRIELDSQMILQRDLQSLVDGDIGAPFLWPLVGNTNDTNGGNVIKVPMPYSKSMIISTAHNPHYYHVVYRELPADADVKTFDLDDTALDALDTARRFGTRSESHTFTVKSGHSSRVSMISGSGVCQILGAPHVEDDGRAYGQGGWSSATFKLDPRNTQCQLTRRLDGTIGHQRAAVTTLRLNPRLTAGKSTIDVKNTFISSDLDFNEFFYALHCKLNVTSDWELMDLLNVGPNNPHDEVAHEYEINGQTWSGVRHYLYGGDRIEQAARFLRLLSNLYLRLTFDGHTTVDGPIGSFFGSALGKFAVRSLMLSIDTLAENGAFTSWWPMPFNHSVAVELVNQAGQPVQGSIDLKWAPWASPPAPWGYFATQHHHAETKTGVLWNFLSETGRGVACGVTQAFRGAILPPNNTLDYLEGDLKVWTNRGGKTGPFDQATMLGTGTEDFYESGWYFTDAQDGTYGSTAVPFAMPLTGMEAHEYRELNCVGECVEASRLMLADSMNFDDGISFNIEHGPVNNDINANYETTAFYYHARD
ncbi:hypothetical protein V1524DRAFT_473363 [Lipomyces starkeyi]